MLIVELKDEDQIKIVCNKFKTDPNIKCILPSKKIPSILISEVDLELQKQDIIDMISRNEDICKDEIRVKTILNNPKFKNNRVAIDLNEKDSRTILEKNEIKLGIMIHPIERSIHVIQCKNCNKFGHFHKSKDKNTVTCKGNQACIHCGEDHDLDKCPVKNNRNAACCLNCKGNHRENSKYCPDKQDVTKKILSRYI